MVFTVSSFRPVWIFFYKLIVLTVMLSKKRKKENKREHRSGLVKAAHLCLHQAAFSWGCLGTSGRTGSQISGQRGTWHLDWATRCHWEENQARKRKDKERG